MLALLIGLSLPWVVGGVWAAFLVRGASSARIAIVLGYGYLLGVLALTVWMRVLGWLQVPFSWVSIAAPMLVVFALGAWLVSRARRKQPVVTATGAVSRLTGMSRSLWWLFALFAFAHLALATVEVGLRPLYPWDAWTQWSTKARVWYALLEMVPFSDSNTWFGGATYTDAAPGYPVNLPLLQVWMSMALGRWDDAMMNLHSVAFAAALALAFYGQLRLAGVAPVLSIFATYALLSLPLLDTHVALAGYADFPLAVFYGLAAIALWQWAITRDHSQAVLAIVLAIACPLTKNPGWLWLLTLLPAVAITMAPRHGVRIIAGFAVMAVVALIISSAADITIFTYHVQVAPDPVLEPLWQNYFEFANWHLLWYLVPVIIALGYRQLGAPAFVAGTSIVATGLAFLLFVFILSSAAAWVTDYSTVNRATLHIAPLLAFYVTRIAQALLDERRSPRVTPEVLIAASSSDVIPSASGSTTS